MKFTVYRLPFTVHLRLAFYSEKLKTENRKHIENRKLKIVNRLGGNCG